METSRRQVRRAIVASCLCFASAGVVADADSPAAAARIPAGALRSDLAVLRELFETLHPGLRRYNSPAELEAAWTRIETKFSEDRTLAEAYLAFSELTASLRCGHTYANFYNQSEAVQAALFRYPRLPFHFVWLQDRMIVTRGFDGGASLPAGTEILAIDSRPVAEIRRALLPLVRADGGNDAKRVSLLEVQGNDRFETFDVFYPLLFPPRGNAFNVTLRRRETGPLETLRMEGQSPEQRLAGGRAGNEHDAGAAPWTLDLPDSGLAVLRMPTWALYESKWDWKGFLDQTFRSLSERRVPDLVIDLRGNEGGLSVGDEILPHLISAELAPSPIERRVRYRRVPEKLLPYLDTWDRSFDDWGASAVPRPDGDFRLTRYDDPEGGTRIRPRAPRFAGRVWVLIGAANSSATFEFAEEVLRYRLGTLVGQPTGGNRRGINGGAFYFVRLPGSGIEIDLPLIASFPAGEATDAGIEPDLPVQATAADIASGRDVEMDAVRAAIVTNRRSRDMREKID